MNLNFLLEKAFESGASDVHICVGIAPTFRIDGELVVTSDQALTPQDTIGLAKQCLSQTLFNQFNETGDVDTSYYIQSLCRFRVNVFKQRGTCAIAFRIISPKIPNFNSLELPGIVKSFTEKKRGLLLVTGPTGSGKSTTLAALIDIINKTRSAHIITIEDPIEYAFAHNKSIINQREIGIDTNSFASSLRAALREDPDVIMVGEMRDQETISIALTAAETGHLVLSTLHTSGTAKTIDRIIDVFSPHQQQQIRSQLSTVLLGVVSQQLIINKGGNGRTVATEVMVLNSAIANLIREAKTAQMLTCIQTGGAFGMQSMDSSLAYLYKNNKIDYETACEHCFDLENLKKIIATL